MLRHFARRIFHRRIAALEAQVAEDVRRLLDGESISLLDVGSAGGIEPRWKPHRSRLRYVGIEPDSRSSAALLQSNEATHYADYRIVPHALWSSDDVISFNLCRKPTVSSHFPPNRDFVSRYPLKERFDVLSSQEIECRTIDSLSFDFDLQPDFMKLDVQGGELAVLQGATNALDRCVGLEIEVEFVRIYERQPLFGDLCAFLEGKGLEFIDFTSFNRWERSQYRGLGQCVFGDALFLRSPEAVLSRLDEPSFDMSMVKRYLALLRIYLRADLMSETLRLLRGRADAPFEYIQTADAILDRLAKYLQRSSKEVDIATSIATLWNPTAKLHLIY